MGCLPVQSLIVLPLSTQLITVTGGVDVCLLLEDLLKSRMAGGVN